MNTSQLKNYAPKAREAFIAAVSAQAARIGITAAGNESAQVHGDILLIAGQAFPKAIHSLREKLVKRVSADGFDAVMEAVAYTWFNRFAAIRYMEVHGYLDHGYRVLSHPEGSGRPELLDHAAELDLLGLDRDRVVELKLDGTKDEELYRLLLLAQCNALYRAMPFLFEKVGAEDELLLPGSLLHTDSLIRRMVEDIDESAWADIEIIGWLYQFYISAKKDQVIGKVVKSEDIPAATQLFTPNWIVKYMVQNSLGAQWLATYPNSPLKAQMEYYIEPAEQTDEVNAQLAAITPDTLNPEELTLIDPACGSGHILVEAYDLFKAIYLERGYRQRDVPGLILEKNLFGLDIDGRAAQLTGFALMMKGRSDDRRLFERGVKLNVMALVDSGVLHTEEQTEGNDLFTSRDRKGAGALAALQSLVDNSLFDSIRELVELFEHATTFGSLIQVPDELAEKLPALRQLSVTTSPDLFVSDALKHLEPLVQQAALLAAQYDSVVVNPPYMGSKGMNALLKRFVKGYFPGAKADLFACFIERGCTFAKDTGFSAMVTMQSWMFLSSFEKMRERMLREKTIRTMAHLGARAFRSISGEVVQTTSFVLQNQPSINFKPVFFRLLDGGEDEKQASLIEGTNRFDSTAQYEFKKIPGSPVAYWPSKDLREIFYLVPNLGNVAETKQGLATTNNALFLRQWHEVDMSRAGLGLANTDDAARSKKKWFPLNKGGGLRRWYGNNEFFIDFESDGKLICDYIDNTPGVNVKSNGRVINRNKYFKEGLTWSSLASGGFSMRHSLGGFIFETKGAMCFPKKLSDLHEILALFNSKLVDHFLSCLSPTLDYHEGPLKLVPTKLEGRTELIRSVSRAVDISKRDWDELETSWDFQSLPILTASSEPTPTLEFAYTAWTTQNREATAEMKRLEEENNRLFINAYGLADELTPDVPIEQITLTVNPAYRYGGKLTEEEQWTRFRHDTMQELVSYAVGCMMGRYSLEEPGLIYAHSGNAGFDASRYTTFPADDDGIVPITDTDWFDDDACNRTVEFISVAWDAAQLEDNLTFLADNLSSKKTESSRETIRRYICDKFFKDHLKTYKKRPIYWLFSSGKQKAFQCLVYLHRYNEGTLSRMRSEYVIPLQGKMAARIEKLQGDIQAATSSAHRKRLEKEQEKLKKQQVELLAFDEKLRHYADARISLDLDDGVKVNYGKFGDLLAEVTAVHGKKSEGV